MTTTYTEQLIEAAGRGDLNGIQRLIGLADISAMRNGALQHAAQNGHVECVRLLLSVCDTNQYMDEVFYKATFAGHLECVKLLAPYVDLERCANRGLINAASGGALEVLQFLLAYADPHFLNSRALFVAFLYNYNKCIEVLKPLSNVADFLAQLEQHLQRIEQTGYETHKAQHLRALKEQLILRDALEGVDITDDPPKQRKI